VRMEHGLEEVEAQKFQVEVVAVASEFVLGRHRTGHPRHFQRNAVGQWAVSLVVHLVEEEEERHVEKQCRDMYRTHRLPQKTALLEEELVEEGLLEHPQTFS